MEYIDGLNAAGVGVGVAVGLGELVGVAVGLADTDELGLGSAVGAGVAGSCARLVIEGNKTALKTISKPREVFHADIFGLDT